MAKYPFLSDDWFDAVEQLVADNPLAMEGGALVVNYVVTESPFGDREFHSTSVDGRGGFGRGHREGADVTITTEYTTAREIFTSDDPSAGMQAYMAGKVKTQGEVAKLLAARVSGADQAEAEELGQQIRDLTE